MKNQAKVENKTQLLKRGVMAGVLVVIIFFTAVLSFLSFQTDVKKILRKSANWYMQETTDKTKKYMKTIIAQYFNELHIIATFCEVNTGEKDSDILALLQKKNNQSKYILYGLVSKEGVAYKGDKKTFNIRENKGFKNTMLGEESVSEVFRFSVTGKDTVMLSVPVMKKGKVDGAVCGFFDIELFKQFIGKTNYNGKGATMIIQRDGKVVSGYDGMEEFSTFYEMLQTMNFKTDHDLQDFIQSVKRGEGGFLTYYKNNNDRYICYEPAGINDWVVISLVIAYQVDWQYNSISQKAAILMAINLIVIILMSMIVVFVLFRSIHLIEERMSNERFKIVSRQTKDIIFEYDCLKKKVFFSENAGILLSYTEHDDLFRFVHSKDHDVLWKMVKDIQKQKVASHTQIRIFTKKEVYEWYEISAEPIINKKGEIIRLIGILQNVDGQKKEIESLIKKSQKDLLTNLYNKISAQNAIEKTLNDSVRDKKHAFYFIDIDDFKNINDTYGHDTGDKVIVKIAGKIKETFNKGDIMGRFGGDEFVVLAKDLPDYEEAENMAEHLCKIVHEDNEYPLSVSVGVSVYPKDGTDYEMLAKKADSALYMAKKRGKNQYYLKKDS